MSDNIRPLYDLNGIVQRLLVFEDRAVIATGKNAGKAIFSVASKIDGAEMKEFYYSEMTALQHKKATIFSNGFMRFDFPGSSNGFAAYNENSFVFYPGLNAEVEPVVEYIRKRIREERSKPKETTIIQQTTSSAQELREYKKLVDEGIITQEEFEEKKKKLLGE